MKRRSFLISAAGIGVLRAADPWAEAAAILGRIRPPVFPKRDFDIAKFGASGDGVKDSTEAIRRAIAAASQAGGGRVVVPAGRYLTGAIQLRSNVNLHVGAGATLLFDRDPRKYLPAVFTRWEGVECVNYSAFLYAWGQENIALTGEGTLDGQADSRHWWPWKGRKEYGWKLGDPSQEKARDRLIKMGEDGVAPGKRVFGEGSYLRPNFVQPYRCKNVLIEGVTILNSPMWELHPTLCRNVAVRGVKVSSHGPNNDGCDPESCADVLIEDCVFDTGDDCIALKSGLNNDGRRVDVPIENVVIRGCQMKDGHGGVTIGSEISGSARNIFAENCRMDSPNLDRVLRLKTNSVRGGVIENVHLRNIAVGQVADAVVQVDFHYEEGNSGTFKPVVPNIGLRNVTSKKSKYALYLRGYEDAPIRDVRLEDCTFEGVQKPDVLEHVQGLTRRNVRVNGTLAS
ncbi:MAG: glycoside hydrolase family 28 protein [Acidobacteria bacterium]|nr:glycoside hydrolase family 28 protein [Acidobacteriota bacterium]